MKRSYALAAIAFCAGISAYAVQSGCVSCHTSDAAIKALYLPPPISSSEAEG